MRFWRKKKTVVESFFHRDDEVEAWQFTRQNFREGAPRFIKMDESKRISLWSQYAGKVIGGQAETEHGGRMIEENDWIVLRNGVFNVYTDSMFKAFFAKAEDYF